MSDRVELAELGQVQVDSDSAEFRIQFFSEAAFRELCGTLGKNLRIIEKSLPIKIHQSGDQLKVVGNNPAAVTQARLTLRQLINVLSSGQGLAVHEVDHICRLLKTEPETDVLSLQKEAIFVGGKKRITPRSQRQKNYFQAIRKNDLVFGIGPAGTGKTFLAMAMALAAFNREEVKRIVLCRPAVEAGEKLGFLPGDMLEKVNPYLRPLYGAMTELAGAEKSYKFIERNIVEVAPLAFMRGRTLSNAFVILDEAQNTTREQMKMFLTRIGIGSKVVVNGDPSQIDLPRNQQSGLIEALDLLADKDGIAMVRMTDADVVRHPLVSTIIRAYARAKDRS